MFPLSVLAVLWEMCSMDGLRWFAVGDPDVPDGRHG